MPIQSKLQTRKSIFEVFELVALCRQTSQGEGKQRTFSDFPHQQNREPNSHPQTQAVGLGPTVSPSQHTSLTTLNTRTAHTCSQEKCRPACAQQPPRPRASHSPASLRPTPRAYTPLAPCCGTRSSRTKRSEAPRNGLSISGRSQGDLSPRRSQLEIVARAQQLSRARSARRARPGRRAGRRGPGWR